jgi:adenylate cyclase class IV
MIEIEVKLKYSDKNKVIAKLIELNAEEKDSFILEDKYFGFNNDMKNSDNLIDL